MGNIFSKKKQKKAANGNAAAASGTATSAPTPASSKKPKAEKKPEPAPSASASASEEPENAAPVQDKGSRKKTAAQTQTAAPTTATEDDTSSEVEAPEAKPEEQAGAGQDFGTAIVKAQKQVRPQTPPSPTFRYLSNHNFTIQNFLRQYPKFEFQKSVFGHLPFLLLFRPPFGG